MKKYLLLLFLMFWFCNDAWAWGNVQEGFRGIKWGDSFVKRQDFEPIEGNRFEDFYRGDYSEEFNSYYTRKGDPLCIGDIAFTKIVYQATDGFLTAVMLHTVHFDQKTIDSLSNVFGKPEDYPPAKLMGAFLWRVNTNKSLEPVGVVFARHVIMIRPVSLQRRIEEEMRDQIRQQD